MKERTPNKLQEQRANSEGTIRQLDAEVIRCRRCPRLIEHCQSIAQQKRRAFRAWEYWGQPVPSFGPEDARLLIVGLAPGAHGANRTGRMFTGDTSGDALYRALFAAGFASQPTAISRDDGLQLRDARITAIVHCAPPGNKPTPEEIRNCGRFLEQEFQLLKEVQGVVVLGQLAFKGYLQSLRRLGKSLPKPQPKFAHGAFYQLGDGLPWLLCSYHPSQQNQFTGRLTQEMLNEIFQRAQKWVK